MYKNFYDWSKYDTRLVPFFSELYSKSINYYNNTVAKESTLSEQTYDKKKIAYFVECVEKYLFGMIKLGYIKSDNKSNIISTLLKLPFISVLSKPERGLFGKTIGGSGIEIRPTLDMYSTLKYVSHELGHYLHNDVNWLKQHQIIFNELDKDVTNIFSKNIGIKDLSSGFALLDEAIVQDTAENITYYFMKKTRPSKQLSDFDIVGECSTNFGYYGEFQEIAENFSEFIDFTSKGSGDLLKDLSLASYDESLSSVILNSCNTPEKRNELVFLLKRMGHIKETKYAEIGKFSSARGNRYSNSKLIAKNLTNFFNAKRRKVIKIDRSLKYEWRFIPIIKFALESLKCSEKTKTFIEEYLRRGINLKIFTKSNINDIIARIVNICDYNDIDNNFDLESVNAFTSKLFVGRNFSIDYKKYLFNMKNNNSIPVKLSDEQLGRAYFYLNDYINSYISRMIFHNTTEVYDGKHSLDDELLYYFSLPLRGVGNKENVYNKNLVLRDLIRRRLNTRFYEGIIKEYSASVNGHEDLLSDYYKILLNIEKYSSCNYSDKLYYLNEIRNLGNKNLDLRDLQDYNVEDFTQRIIRVR